MKKRLLSILLITAIGILLANSVKADETVTVTNDELAEYSNLDKTSRTVSGSSIDDKWYYNTGESLPRRPDYTRYNLLNSVEMGDIIYEKNGFGGLTGHIAIVEGIQYDSSKNMKYVRIVEAIKSGVCRSVLDDDRVDWKDAYVYRVKDSSFDQQMAAVNFCIGQIGKKYKLDLTNRGIDENQKSWYCSRLVWAAYKNQGIDIETTGSINEPGITPRDIMRSSKVQNIRFTFK